MCLAQAIIIVTMYIFTPLNMILFTKMLKKPVADHGEGEEGGEGEHAHFKVKFESKQGSGDLLLAKRAKLVNESETGFKVIFKRLDELVLKPILIRDYEARVLKISKMKLKEEKYEGRKTFFDPVSIKARLAEFQDESVSEDSTHSKDPKQTTDLGLSDEYGAEISITDDKLKSS